MCLYILIKVLLLLNSKLIIYLAIVRDIKNLVVRYTRLFILGREVVLTKEDNKE